MCIRPRWFLQFGRAVIWFERFRRRELSELPLIRLERRVGSRSRLRFARALQTIAAELTVISAVQTERGEFSASFREHGNL